MSEFNIKFRSKYLSAPIDVAIITPVPTDDVDPEAYYNDSNLELPVVWLFQAGYSGFADWITYMKAPRYAVERNCILVAPHGPNCDYANQAAVGEGFYFEDFFLKELVPFVRTWFHGSRDPEKNLMAGSSMGCAATWRYGISYPEIFGYIAPIANQPLNYNYLEEYRGMSTIEFRELTKVKDIPTAYGIDLGRIHAKELGVICRYRTVGDFLDSIENTWARFEDAAQAGRLPKIYLTGAEEAAWGPGMTMFREYCEKNNVKNVTFDLYNCPTHNSAFVEEGLERFMEFAGLKKVKNTLI